MQFGQLGDFFRPDHISRFWPLGDMALRLTEHTGPLHHTGLGRSG